MLFNNPIDLVDDHGLVEFDTLRDFYLKVLQVLYQDLHDYTLLRGSPLGECCRDIERGWEESEDFCIKVHWTYGVQTRDKLTDLLRKMTRFTTGTYFDLRQFDAAWSTFFQSINKE